MEPLRGETPDTPPSRVLCLRCGYGATRRVAPERCPTCGDSAWVYLEWRSFTDASVEQAADQPLSRDDL